MLEPENLPKRKALLISHLPNNILMISHNVKSLCDLVPSQFFNHSISHTKAQSCCLLLLGFCICVKQYEFMNAATSAEDTFIFHLH